METIEGRLPGSGRIAGTPIAGSRVGVQAGNPLGGYAGGPLREVVLASPDLHFRGRVRQSLEGSRWRVREARGGAEALHQLSATPCLALLLDSWLPDLEIEEFIAEFRRLHPQVELIQVDEPAPAHGTRLPGTLPATRTPSSGLLVQSGGPIQSASRSSRNELLFALRRGRDPGAGRPAIVIAGTEVTEGPGSEHPVEKRTGDAGVDCSRAATRHAADRVPDRVPDGAVERTTARLDGEPELRRSPETPAGAAPRLRVNELIGCHPLILEVSRRIRLAAPHDASVLIQGATGTGKELVAKALHRLSARSARPFAALNCAAIPEALVETELFGHARGAFTGAIQRRVGRIEAAAGGTLLLDEIGELPLSMQAKLLRFVESGELQRVGENETMRVDVRIVAATHRPLAQLAREGRFREDLYYRLAVFLIHAPPLSAHREDIELLAKHFLAAHFAAGRFHYPGQSGPRTLTWLAMERLRAHPWPGNVRELEHVLERSSILAEDRREIEAGEIEFADDPRGLTRSGPDPRYARSKIANP